MTAQDGTGSGQADYSAARDGKVRRAHFGRRDRVFRDCKDDTG